MGLCNWKEEPERKEIPTDIPGAEIDIPTWPSKDQETPSKVPVYRIPREERPAYETL